MSVLCLAQSKRTGQEEALPLLLRLLPRFQRRA